MLIKDKTGFSIMEVMVGLGMLGILTFGFLQYQKAQTVSQKKNEIQNALSSVESRIISQLASRDACNQTFKDDGQVINQKSPGQAKGFVAFNGKNNSNGSSYSILKRGDKVDARGTLQFDRIDQNSNGDDHELVFFFKNTKTNQEYKKSFKIVLTTNNDGTIKGCTSRSDAELLKTQLDAQRNACLNSGGQFNEETTQCALGAASVCAAVGGTWEDNFCHMKKLIVSDLQAQDLMANKICQGATCLSIEEIAQRLDSLESNSGNFCGTEKYNPSTHDCCVKKIYDIAKEACILGEVKPLEDQDCLNASGVVKEDSIGKYCMLDPSKSCPRSFPGNTFYFATTTLGSNSTVPAAIDGPCQVSSTCSISKYSSMKSQFCASTSKFVDKFKPMGGYGAEITICKLSASATLRTATATERRCYQGSSMAISCLQAAGSWNTSQNFCEFNAKSCPAGWSLRKSYYQGGGMPTPLERCSQYPNDPFQGNGKGCSIEAGWYDKAPTCSYLKSTTDCLNAYCSYLGCKKAPAALNCPYPEARCSAGGGAQAEYKAQESSIEKVGCSR